MSVRSRLDPLLRYSRSTLWVWPTITVAVALVVGTLLSEIDIEPTWVFTGGPGAGRLILTALVGGLVTALSVIFSITIIGLQAVHSEYAPRLLPNFIQDSGAKVVLSTFAGVVAYMLAVLRAIPGDDFDHHVPRFAISFGMVLFLLCVGVVAYYAQHITYSLRVGSALDRVVNDTLTHGPDLDAAASVRVVGDELPVPPADAPVVMSQSTGYLQDVDVDALGELAERHDAFIRLRPMIGDHVVEGTPLAWVWPQRELETSGADGVDDAVNRAVTVDPMRLPQKDIAYGVRQLVDVAIRAMSPSMNDPYTAVQAIDHIAVILTPLARDGVPTRVYRNADGKVLAGAPNADVSALVTLACDQIRRYGVHEPAVAVRLITMLRDLGSSVHEDLRPHLREEVARIVETAERKADEADDLRPLRREAEVALSWIDGEIALEDVVADRL